MTIYRNPLLNQEMPTSEGTMAKDEFQPRYELEYGLPDVPARPKLFRFVDVDEKSADNSLHKYAYSSIEMTQELNGMQN